MHDSHSVKKTSHFIRQIIEKDIQAGKNDGRVVTRFPPEPNGFLHIGHAKSICLNFGLALDYQGVCHLRFDDTNPHKEDLSYMLAIKEDVKWLGFDWGEHEYHASDYFQQLYDYAIELIKREKAFVCSLSAENIRLSRGTLTTPGEFSPYRDRSVKENLDLFERMRAGEFDDGAHVLRAKIDMASPNMNMRDPTLYRIRHVPHHLTGNAWCIYPTYDYTHCLSDAIEGITHSLCTLEFEDHRPLYEWVINTLDMACKPQQIEFSRLSLEYTVTSKRLLNALIDEQHVSAWDDPRLPTIAGMRRRGYTSASIRHFCDCVGISKSDNFAQMSLLENCIREDLDPTALRVMGVLHPLKVILENYPEDQSEALTAANHPQNAKLGQRSLPWTREIYIDSNDFQEVAENKKFKRLTLGGEVRLRYGYIIRCDRVIKDEVTGEILELRCHYDENTLGKHPEGRKVKGVIHWVSASQCCWGEVRLYDRLFTHANPGEDKNMDFKATINPNSLTVHSRCALEVNLQKAQINDRFQFEREGYFCLDSKDSQENRLVFNRIVTLRDTWGKIVGKR